MRRFLSTKLINRNIRHKNKSLRLIKNKKNVTNKNFCAFEKARQHGLLERGTRINFNGLVAFQALNKIKEMELIQRVKGGNKIRVAFYVDSLQLFHTKNIYWEMLHDPLFEPFIYYSWINYPTDGKLWQHYLHDLNILRKKGFNVKASYSNRGNLIPLEHYNPDILFSHQVYLNNFISHNSSEALNLNFLVCLVNYGFNISNSYEYHYNNRHINTAWKYFVETLNDYLELRTYSMHFGFNTILTGHPEMDDYLRPLELCKIPKKIDNGNPIVIYAPHWSINHPAFNLGTFDLYNEYFISLAKNNPQINFIFRPHAVLGARLNLLGIMDKGKFLEYCETWDKLPNGCFYIENDFIDIFRKSSLLITDSASFLAWWLPTMKPCIYLMNPRNNRNTIAYKYSPLARDILEAYYKCYNLNEIDKIFKQFLAGQLNIDIDLYKKLIKQVLPYKGSASKRIVAYLKDILCN